MARKIEKKLSRMIKTLIPGLTELGKIKIGMKGETRQKQGGGGTYQLPKKIDHFIVTSLERDSTGNFMKDKAIHKSIGDNPKRIPVTLLFDNIQLNFQSRMACYNGTKLFCTGDGENAIETLRNGFRECPCARSERDFTPAKDRCKMNGVLSVIIRGGGSVGGVWKFRTTSFNTIQGITSTLVLIKQITGGPLSGLDLDLVISPKTATAPDGQTQKIYVVGLEFPGDMDALRGAALKLVQADSSHRKQLALLEASTENMIEQELSDENAEDTVVEYYPENDPNYVEPETASIDLEDGNKVDTKTGEVAETEAEKGTDIESEEIQDDKLAVKQEPTIVGVPSVLQVITEPGQEYNEQADNEASQDVDVLPEEEVKPDDDLPSIF